MPLTSVLLGNSTVCATHAPAELSSLIPTTVLVVSNHKAPDAGAPAGAVLLAVNASKSTSALITIARFAAPKNE